MTVVELESANAERLVEMMPYLPVFRTIEQAALETERLEPQIAYEIYDDFLVKHGLDPIIYLSMAITSGGFARDKTLGIGDVIGQNSIYGVLAKQALLNQHPELSPRDIILPSELGKVRGWSQADYLLFWFHVMVGLKPDEARRVSLEMTPSLKYPGFVDKTLAPEEKWGDYARFTRDYVGALQRLGKEYGRDLNPNNIMSMIMILDSDMSLGGRAEELLCRNIGIPPQFQYLDAKSIIAVENLSVTTWRLRALGASSLTGTTSRRGPGLEGFSAGATNPNLAFKLGFRKTGLSNALFAARYYREYPERRPLRHQGHTPLVV